MPLYNLFQKELAKFWRYLNTILNKSWIKFSTSFVDTSILFVSKKGGRFRLYVNYKNLIAIFIKNRHFLSLITKTLNRLYEIKRFTKLNFKDVYHRIRIKRMTNERRRSARVMNILNIRSYHLTWQMHRSLFRFILIRRWEDSLILLV